MNRRVWMREAHLQEWTHLIGTQRAVQTNTKWFCVHHTDGECLNGLATQSSPAQIGDGPADKHRHTSTGPLKVIFNRIDSCLGIEGVKDGFHQQQISAAFQKPTKLLVVSLL